MQPLRKNGVHRAVHVHVYRVRDNLHAVDQDPDSRRHGPGMLANKGLSVFFINIYRCLQFYPYSSEPGVNHFRETNYPFTASVGV